MKEQAAISSATIQVKSQSRHRSGFLNVIRKLMKHKILYLMMLPTIVIVLINNYLPMFGIIVAFKNVNYTKGILRSPWVGFDNFKYLFSTSDAWLITRNTILYNAVFIILNLIAALTFAIMLNEIKNRFLVRLYQSTMLLPYFLSAIVVSYLGYAFLSEEHGFINIVILKFLGKEAISWYNEPRFWPYILPLINMWKSVGYFTIIYLAAIIGIDDEYYEAAVLDGANKLQQIIKVTIPLITPVILVMTLLQIGRIFYADFGLFYQVPLNSGALFSTTNVIDTYVYRSFLKMGDIGMSSAAGLYQATVGFILVIGSNYIVRKINKENALF
jgi:putative aldouronate transport system permease protein